MGSRSIRACVVMWLGGSLLTTGAIPTAQTAASPPTSARAAPNADALKRAAVAEVDSLQTLTQQMVDSLFSFGELGFQEYETSTYLVALLRKNGFTVEEGVAGIPTAWVATWGPANR